MQIFSIQVSSKNSTRIFHRFHENFPRTELCLMAKKMFLQKKLLRSFHIVLYAVKGLGIPGKLNAVCGCAVGHELSHTLFAVRHLPSTVCLADLPAHHAQHIRQSPRRQLGCFYGYGYRAPGNIFINQLHRLPPWDNLSRSAITDPHGLFSAFDGSPPKKNRL